MTTGNKTAAIGKSQLQANISKDLSIPLSPSSKNKNKPHAIIQSESAENNMNLSHIQGSYKPVEKSIAHLQKNQLYASLGNTGGPSGQNTPNLQSTHGLLAGRYTVMHNANTSNYAPVNYYSLTNDLE